MADFSQWWWQAAGVDPGPGPGPDAGDPIGQSLRFRGAQKLERSVTSASSSDVYTFSAWYKAAKTGAYVLTGGNGTICEHLSIQTSAAFRYNPGATNDTLALFRDTSAWYHIVIKWDKPNYSIFVNGVRQAVQNDTPNGIDINGSSSVVRLFASKAGGAYGDGYLAAVYFIDGEALEPTAFGRFNSQGVWVPVDPQGLTYGTNGFKLTFEDPSDIGKDYSGNGNDFSDTGFELADQTSPDYDLMEDSPTQNWATLNSVFMPPSGTPSDTWNLAKANLQAYGTRSAAMSNIQSTIGDGLGQKFVEITCNAIASSQVDIGFREGVIEAPSRKGQLQLLPTSFQFLDSSGTAGLVVNESPVGKTFGFLTGASNGTIEIYVNGVLTRNDTWTLGPQATFQFTSYASGESDDFNVNFGQRPYAFPPAGVTQISHGLQTQNMPTDELPDEITGTFTGNSSADGPFVYTGCIPGRIQYGSVNVTYDQRLGQTDVDFLSNGFKVRSTNSNSGTVNYTVTTTHTGGEYDGKKIPFYLPAPATSN